MDFKALNSASTVIPSKALTLAKTFEVSGFEPEDEFASRLETPLLIIVYLPS